MPYEEAIYLAELAVERDIDQIIQDADDALMLEAWSRIDMSIMATLVA